MDVKAVGFVNFQAQLHRNTIKQIGDAIVNEGSNVHSKMLRLENFKNSLRTLSVYGDESTTFAMYFPREGNFVVTNPKLGVSMVKYGRENFSSVTVDEAVGKLAHTGNGVHEAEEKLFNQYMTDMAEQKGMSPMQVVEDLREKGEFADRYERYLGENGLFTIYAKKRTTELQKRNAQQAEMLKVDEEIKNFVKSLAPDMVNDRNLVK